jgi:uncharacterized protein YdeI (BOF family)
MLRKDVSIAVFASACALGVSGALAQEAVRDASREQQPHAQSENQSGERERGDTSASQQGATAGAQTSGGDAKEAQRSQASMGKEKKSSGPNPYAKPDDSWVSLSGTVKAIDPDSFLLDYGEQDITVEMDDADRQAETYALRMGDKVTVNGAIDDDFFENTTIEASSVYIEKLGRYFFASALDEEDFAAVTYVSPIDSGVAVHGMVTNVTGDEFTIDNGLRRVRIDVGDMTYDPLDDDGYQKIEVGDVVRVEGRIDDDFFESREIMARSIVTLAEEIG